MFSAVQMALKIQHFGRYTLLGLMARGGMGEIYWARLLGVAGFEKRCVIKKIRRELASDTAFVERFLNEGRTLVALTHSNIVQIFDMGEVGGEYYLAMEFVEGADLRVLLRRIRPKKVPVAIALAVTVEVLRGLSYAHRAMDSEGHPLGIVHGDISPSNVLISTEGEVKIIDFGIARGLVQGTQGSVEGKFAYMSPEQAHGEVLDCRTDIFSVGIVLYEMLAAVRPFEENASKSDPSELHFEGARPLSSLNEEIDAQLSALVSRALSPIREERFESADAFFDALVAYMRDRHCMAGQRDVMAYFKPFMNGDLPVAASVDEFLSSELDGLIGAQAFGATRTKTVVPTLDGLSGLTSSQELLAISREPVSSDSHPSVSREPVSSDSHPLVSREPVSSDSHPLVSREPVSSESHPSVSRDALSEMPPGEELSLWDERNKRRSPIRRFFVRLRYVFLGIMVATLGIMVYSWYLWGINSPEDAEKFRQTIKTFRETGRFESEQISEAVESVPSLQSSGSGREARDSAQAFYDLYASGAFGVSPRDFRVLEFTKGVPVGLHTLPDQSSIYIVEGEYRALDGKQFVLLPGRDVEIAIQSLGYETCLMRFRFDEKHKFEKIHWERCGKTESFFDIFHGRFEYLVALEPMRARNIESVNGDSGDTASASERDAAASARGSDGETSDVQELEKTPSRPRKNASAKSAVEPVRGENKTRHDASRTRADNRDISRNVAVQLTSNRSAAAKSGESSCRIPCAVYGAQGEGYEVVPEVSGRQIAIPYRASFHAGQGGKNSDNIRFCEMTIRILESFIEGDPAPYQLSDIAIDGRVAAHQVDRASFVLPCGSHTVTARTQSGAIRLSASATIQTDDSKPVVQAIRLAQE